ncbi:Tn3 family transposase [Streptomyces sp. NPDC051366]|uniref:Tn3 family transposase n=1 Tax=Streptomyces sp. NPDC051366 TaxID=3365652 RepID=UPI003787E272
MTADRPAATGAVATPASWPESVRPSIGTGGPRTPSSGACILDATGFGQDAREPGKNVIDWDLIEYQFRHLMKVVVSVREGAISSSTLLKRLRSGSKKNATYAAFREVGRVIRTVQLLRYLPDPALRRRVTAATNKTESFNRFGEYSTHELGIQPEAYDPKLDVDFTQLREQDLTAAGLGQPPEPASGGSTS